MNLLSSRRSLLLGAASVLAGVALPHVAQADAPTTALRPPSRPDQRAPVQRPGAADYIRAADLGGTLGYVVADARTGLVLEQGQANALLPPASVTKVITSLYALAALGPAHRFTTRLIGTGPVTAGVLEGDLVLAGGGDPVLDTDQLASLAARLRQAGVRKVRGAFKVWAGALPYATAIDPGQPAHLGYNPAVCGLNLNFNRVYFEWARSGAGYTVSMDARTDRLRPTVSMARITVADRNLPVFTYALTDGVDDWTVARSALGDAGSRWLPVRQPALYAGDVFRSLARAQGIELAPVTQIAALPEGTALAQWQSDPLEVLIGDMLRFSTNLTAETLGLTATAARGIAVSTLAQSADAMNRWVSASMGVRCAVVDHSGLGDGSAITAGEMVTALVAAGTGGVLRSLLKDIPLLDDAGEPMPRPPGIVAAKTGTLNFVSALAGYIRTAGGADLAFAIFCADPASRTTALQSEAEVPDGARDWNQRARRLQQDLLQRWATIYAG